MTLLNKIKSKIDSHDIISFDIFDTLLLRPYVKPTDLFFHLEHIEQIWWFRDNRVKAEQCAREIHSDKEDISIDDIYNELSEPFSALKEKELELERKTLFPNPEMKEVFNYTKEKKKKIIITSDMYLPKNFLEKILEEKGFGGYSKLYLSCDINKTKWNGTLYEYILSDLNVNGTQILHIGDNEQSDIQMARKYRISTHHYPKAIDRLFKLNLRANEFYKIHSGEVGSSILLGVLSIYNLYKNSNYWQDFGFKYGGPVVYGYMQWLSQKLQQDNINEAMFVARDGYTLKKVFDIVKNTDIKSHYYYAPRIINLVCNLNYKHYMDIDEKGGLAAIRPILAYFKNKDDFLRKNTPDIKTSVEGDTFIKEHFDIYQKLALKEQKNYQNYFKQFNIRNKEIALIDTCSTMLSAQKSLMIGLPDKNIKGYYWFTWEGTQKDISQYSTTTFQQSHRQEFLDWNIMELYMTAPTPPADKIENGKVIFKKITQNEQKRIEIYPDLSKGMVNYAKFMNNIFGKINVFMNDRILIDWTNILCRIPTPKDRLEFKTIQHAWDIEHTKYIPLPAPWFNQALQPLTIDYKTSCLKIFCFLPIFKKEIDKKDITTYLFNKIPLFKEKCKPNKRIIKIFNFLTLYKVKYSQDDNSEFPDALFLLFGFIPIIKIKKEINMYGREKTKFYMRNFRVLTIKRSKI